MAGLRVRIIALDIDDSLLGIICTITIRVGLTRDVPTVSMAASCVSAHNKSPNCLPNLALSPQLNVGIIRKIQIKGSSLAQVSYPPSRAPGEASPVQASAVQGCY